MKLYNRISLCLSAILLLLCLGTVWWARLHGAPARDGFGPDPLAILAYLLMWAAGIVLVHSTLVAVVLLAGGESRAAEAKKSLLGNGILWLLVIAIWGLPKLATVYDGFQYSQLATSKTFDAIQRGSLEDFEKRYAQAKAEGSYDKFVDTVKFEAESAARVDIMKSLKDKGIVFAAPDKEDEWINSVLYTVRSEGPDNRARLEAVRWLLGEGEPFGYSLRRKSGAFADPQLYWKTYENLSDPVTQQLLDLLIAHGVDITACNDDGEICPLSLLAGFGKIEAVRYLIAHAAPLDKADRYGDTALAGAIRRGSAETVQVLLDAGASISRTEYHNDVMLACDMLARGDREDKRQVLKVLRDADVRITADDVARYKAGMPEGEEGACVRGFM